MIAAAAVVVTFAVAVVWLSGDGFTAVWMLVVGIAYLLALSFLRLWDAVTERDTVKQELDKLRRV